MPQKTVGVAFVCWLLAFVGLFGIHRFYLGFVGTGLLWLFTLGLLGVGQLIDLFRLRNLVLQANLQRGLQTGTVVSQASANIAPVINVHVGHRADVPPVNQPQGSVEIPGSVAPQLEGQAARQLETQSNLQIEKKDNGRV